MHFRLATHFDFPEIIEILEELNLDMEEIEPGQFVVCEHEGVVIGTGRARSYDGFAEFCSIGVVMNHRRKGVGRGIVNLLLNINKGMQLYVVTEIPLFFEKFGFEHTEAFPEAIAQKKNRCLNELACNKALVLKRI